jgi:hypothetical protein
MHRGNSMVQHGDCYFKYSDAWVSRAAPEARRAGFTVKRNCRVDTHAVKALVLAGARLRYRRRSCGGLKNLKREPATISRVAFKSRYQNAGG